MKISIITPVYNAEKTLEQTIWSVINQKINSDIEYIIIDGGSQDKTLEIISQYSHHINLLISEKDKGIYDAMNKGINLATGDVIGIINSDDWYNESALSVVEKVFLNHPEVSIVYSPVKNYVNGQYISTFQPGALENLAMKFTIGHPSCFVKKKIYEQVGLFDLTYTMAADYNFISQAYISGVKFYYVDTPLASFSLNGKSGQLLNRLKLLQETWQIASSITGEASEQIKIKRRFFYLNWLLREIATLPIKYFDPLIALKVKGFLRQRIGKLSSDQYGAW
ncbi:family 2 glycosyl transferase [Calothrix sp. NIES-4101]|nr:family 2 glycosyl transferase [Calothrix sp. NIES-4101]